MSLDAIPAKPLLALHAAIDPASLFRASHRLLEKCFSHHFVVAGFAFREEMPLVIKRTAPAPERDADWWARNAAAHPMMHKVMADPDMKIGRVTDLMTVEEIKASDYYRDFVEEEGWLYSTGLFFRDGRQMFGMLAVNRTEEQGEFTAGEMKLFEVLYPHFETAIRRVARIQADQASTVSMATMMSRLPLAMAVVSWRGEVVYINDAAREASERWKAGDLSVVAAQTLSLVTLPPDIMERCQALIAEFGDARAVNVDQKFSVQTVVHASDPAQRVSIEILGAAVEPLTEPALLVRFENTGTDDYSASALAQLAELSTAEKSVVERLLMGESNREIAAALGKSAGTVKKQLESIYRKLDVHDRVRLVAKLTKG